MAGVLLACASGIKFGMIISRQDHTSGMFETPVIMVGISLLLGVLGNVIRIRAQRRHAEDKGT